MPRQRQIEKIARTINEGAWEDPRDREGRMVSLVLAHKVMKMYVTKGKADHALILALMDEAEPEEEPEAEQGVPFTVFKEGEPSDA